MPLAYLWLFAFVIPLSCTVTLMSQIEADNDRESVSPRHDGDLTD